jgi:hypothetical protein
MSEHPTFGKSHPESKKRIDAGVALTLALHGRHETPAPIRSTTSGSQNQMDPGPGPPSDLGPRALLFVIFIFGWQGLNDEEPRRCRPWAARHRPRHRRGGSNDCELA